MEEFELNEQKSRLEIITWLSFGIALICFISFLSDLFSTPLNEYVKNINSQGAELSQSDQNFIRYLKELRYKQDLTNIFGIFISVLFICSSLGIYFKKKWAIICYYSALILAIVYNLISAFNISSNNKSFYQYIGGSPNQKNENIVEYLSQFASQFQVISSLIFIVIALSYLSFNLFFLQNGKTKYLLNELFKSDK